MNATAAHAPAPARAHEISDEWNNARLDAAVRGLWQVPWSKARAWISAGKVSIGDDLCLDPARIVLRGEMLGLSLEARRLRRPTEIDRRIVVHMDDHVIVVRKPAGISTVPFDGPDREALDEQLRRLLSAKPGPRRGARPAIYVVHRLDRGTSGLLVFARTAFARDRLAAQFKEHTVHRRYLAIAHGVVNSARFESHLVVDRGDGVRGSSERAKDRTLRRTGGGKRAVTHVECLEPLRGASLVSCRLETGRTNQIRIHLSEAGHPLLGETVYLRDYASVPLPAPRLMLHAQQLGFVHPATGAPIQFVEPLPEDMASVLESLRPRP